MKNLLLIVLLLVNSSGIQALDVQVQDENIQEFLPWLATETGNSLLLSPDIKARINLSLKETNWQSLLTLLASNHGLELSWLENTAVLMPKIPPNGKEQKAVDCQVYYWPIENAKSEVVSKHLQTLFSKVIFSYDERTNTIVGKTCIDVKNITQTIAWLDAPLVQIEISARIAQVQSTVEDQIGVEWENQIGSSVLSSVVGVADLGLTASNSGLSFSIVNNDELLALNLQFLETQGLANIVSEPKVVTEEGHTARIESGTEIPYQTTDDDQTTVEFKQAGLTLEVTPYIKIGERIQLQLKIYQDAVGEIYNGIPSIETNRISTQVTVKNNETLVLGGIYRDEIWKTSSAVPFFSRLPLIGALFRKETERQEKMELLVFITPKLLQMSNY